MKKILILSSIILSVFLYGCFAFAGIDDNVYRCTPDYLCSDASFMENKLEISLIKKVDMTGSPYCNMTGNRTYDNGLNLQYIYSFECEDIKDKYIDLVYNEHDHMMVYLN